MRKKKTAVGGNPRNSGNRVGGFLPTPHYCDAVAFGYLIPPCQRLIGDFHPSYVSCLTYYESPHAEASGDREIMMGRDGY